VVRDLQVELERRRGRISHKYQAVSEMKLP
jgi:hypothetical protein